MAEKDIAEKALEAYDDVFADIVNNLVYGGRTVVKEEELLPGRERSAYLGDNALREQERDTSKFWHRNHIRIAYFGLENETEPEDDMPFRVIGYDGAAYRDQIFYEVGKDGKRRKGLTRYPVVTLVLYFGYRKRWDRARSIFETLGDRLEEGLRDVVHDYPINLYEIAYLSDEQLAGFRSDFRFVADYFVQMQRSGEYRGSNENMRHVREVLQLLTALTKDRRFAEVIGEMQDGKEEVQTMSEALDIIEARGIQKGIQQGVSQGADEVIRNALANIGSVEETARVLNLTVGRVREAQERAGKREDLDG